MSRLILDVYGISDVGIRKDVNEDSFVYKVANIDDSVAGLFAVADGVGGLSEGDRASQTCIRRINLWWESELTRYSGGEGTIDTNSLRESIIDSNSRILKMSADKGVRSGTTLTMLAVFNKRAVIAHVGDSRCYRLRKNILWHFNRMTTDHSCEKTNLVDGVTTVKTVLTDCIGFRQDFRLDISEIDISDGDSFLLCSDGIYKTQDDSVIEECMRRERKAVKNICEELVNGAKEKKETDNISVIALTVSSGDR
ncbi:MAG: protein phosphatase 2C domain-containing protein [Clostridia bacterium]|nr:protein phosphatase 2C domain-containing protein [Clostridia bacterium]